MTLGFVLTIDSSDSLDVRAQGAQTVRRALAVLRLVASAQEQGARLTDLVLASGFSRPTVHRLLQVLREEGVVEQDSSTRRYKIGPELTLLGMARGNRFPIRAIAEPSLRQLSQKVGDTVFLTVRQGSDSVGIDRVTGHYPIQVLVTQVGIRRPLGVGVAGVAILSTLDPEEATSIVRANQRRLAVHSLSVTGMEERIACARERGFAWAPKGLVPGTSAVSVPVLSKKGVALAAVSVAAMAPRLSSDRLPLVVEALREAACRIALRHEEIERARGKR